MAQLTCKMLRTKIKAGWSTHDFLTTFDMTEEQFHDYILKKFSNGSTGVFRQLSSNDKFSKRMAAPSEDKSEDSAITSEACVVSSLEETVTELEAEDNSMEEQVSSVSPIDELRTLESRLSSELCAKETVREQLLSDRRMSYDALSKQRAEIIRLRALVDQELKSVDETLLQLDNISSKLEELNLQIAESQKQLDSTRLQIKSLEKVFVYCFTDGKIEVENYQGEVPALCDDCSSILPKFLENPDFESITLKEVKQYSRLLALVQILKEQGLSFEVSFDNPTLQHAWEVQIAR